MIKISFTPEFLQWVALQMRANDTGLDARQFAGEFFQRAFVGRGAEVATSAPLLLAACEAALSALTLMNADEGTAGEKLRAAIAAAKGEV